MSRSPVLAAVGALAVLVPAVAGCSGGGTPSRSPAASTPSTSAAHAVATRWWSNGAATVGSTLSPGHADAAAAHLHPSRPEYCTMLRQTVAAGRSILTGNAQGTALSTSTAAFVAEVQAVAPAEVTAAWRTLGTAVVALVRSGASAADAHSISTTAVRRAGAAIAADAERGCHLDLTPGVTG